ncbi:MAG: coproporphyrinogen III oxidase, partial [Microcoleus sp. SIO2G3]|nr:coproporphyrinogen III oxidase [Microcoleus sp. SIO2G3]
RLAEGVSLAVLAEQFGEKKVEEIHECLQPYYEKGWVEVVQERLRLTDPDGFLFSNVVLAGLFKELGE